MKKGSTASNSLPIEIDKLKKASGIFRAADHPMRQQILQYIHQHLRVNVGTIYKKLKIEQSITSQHLGILRSAKLVSTERDGKLVFYSINYERLKLLQKAAEEMIAK